MVAIAGSGWRLAPCLVDLFEEADERDPNRDTSSDGSIGNAEHSARESDHNPDDGWVCAADIDDDDDQKSPGVDLLRAHLVATKDPRVKYLIRNGTIWKAYENRGLPPWTPQVYTGLNAHKSHLHISVWNTGEARNDLRPWWPQSQPAPQQEEDDDMAEPSVIAYLKNPKSDATHAYHLKGITAKWCTVEATTNLLKYIGVQAANTRAGAYPVEYQNGLVIVDGPCRNTP